MINLPRVAQEIKDVGLYDLILQDVQKIAKKKKLSIEEILELMDKNPQILEEYKQVNVEYNLSNIHIDDIDISKIDEEHHKTVDKFNANLKKLKEIEKYTLDFEHSSTLIIIFSIEFFVLFSVQYFIVLMDLKEWQLLIYGLFGSSIIVAWLYARKQKKLYDKNSKIFDSLYLETKYLINELDEKEIICKKNIFIKSNDEHV
ncbi:MAG: hypothetical protein L3J44_00405 [Campylobacteraceae bacterium]|nr:hypothetical protein [Campylobacteraceae bacterium]